MTVTYDQALQPGTSLVANWRLHRLVPPADLGAVANLTIAGNTVSGLMAGFGPMTPVADTHDYFAAPPDVIGLTGLPVAPYAAFPTAMI